MIGDDMGSISNSEVFNLTFAGRSFKLDSHGHSDAVTLQMRTGGYEAPLPMLTMAIIARTKGLFIDVGANNGLYSILCAITRPGARVMAFEPFDAVVAVLERNIRLNDLEKNVVVERVALSDRVGSAKLFLPDQRHGLVETSCSLEQSFKDTNEFKVVDVRTLDSYSIQEEISLIKADIEGHEAPFLRGALNTIAKYRPVIFAEMLQGAEKFFPEIDLMLLKIGYLRFRLRANMSILCDRIVYDSDAWNHCFVPADKISLFESCCIAHSLPIVQLVNFDSRSH